MKKLMKNLLLSGGGSYYLLPIVLKQLKRNHKSIYGNQKHKIKKGVPGKCLLIWTPPEKKKQKTLLHSTRNCYSKHGPHTPLFTLPDSFFRKVSI